MDLLGQAPDLKSRFRGRSDQIRHTHTPIHSRQRAIHHLPFPLPFLLNILQRFRILVCPETRLTPLLPRPAARGQTIPPLHKDMYLPPHIHPDLTMTMFIPRAPSSPSLLFLDAPIHILGRRERLGKFGIHVVGGERVSRFRIGGGGGGA